MRSPFLKPPVSIKPPVGGRLPRANPMSTRVFVVGFIWANTCVRYNGTIVLPGQAFTSEPRFNPRSSSSS
jgi:hypothetical protein